MNPTKAVSGSSNSSPTPKRKSWVASRYIVFEEGGMTKRRCNFLGCTKVYSTTTSHIILRKHWSIDHNDQFSEHLLSTDPSKKNNTPSLSPRKKKNANAPSSRKHNNATVKSEKVNRHDLILNSTSNNSLNSGFDVKLVAKRLKEAASIHLTFDINTPKKGAKSHGIITAHSPSDTLDVKSVILDYRHIPYPDDSNTIYETLRGCITKFNIREKIISIACSCSSSIETAVNELDKRYRLSKNFNYSALQIQCFPQFVHINVIDVLKSQEALVESVRKVIGFINSNHITFRPVTNEATVSTAGTVMSESVNSEDNTNQPSDINSKATGLKLPHDTRGNWNTTYNMIETFIQQRSFIEPALMYFQNPEEMPSPTIDWDRLFMLNQLLKPFYEVISKFASDNYTPVSLVAVCIPHLMDHLSNSSSWAYQFDDLVMAADNFKMNLETYRQVFQSELTVIAGLLDPRVKDTFVSTEGKEDAINMLCKRLESSGLVKNDSHAHSNDFIWSRVFRQTSQNEIEDYLQSPREHELSSNFAYWESHKHVYPGLYALARSLICIQASSVTNDKMFSAGESFERERKAQMDGTNSRELMKSWAKYLEK